MTIPSLRPYILSISPPLNERLIGHLLEKVRFLRLKKFMFST
jgi:hypothetical protein